MDSTTEHDQPGSSAADLEGLEIAATADLDREPVPLREVLDHFFAGREDQADLGPDAVYITMNAGPPHPPRTLADYERLAGPQAAS